MLQIVHETLRQRARSGSAASTSGRGAAGAAAAAASPAAVPCVLSSEDRELHVAVSPDGLSAQSRSEKAWGGVRGSVGVFASCGGKVYYEVRRCGSMTGARLESAWGGA